jgi:hypothetical protein
MESNLAERLGCLGVILLAWIGAGSLCTLATWIVMLVEK